MYILYVIGLVLSLLAGGVIGLMLARSRHRRYKAEVARYLEVYADMALSRRVTAGASADWQAPAA
jgi:hypothetical protein